MTSRCDSGAERGAPVQAEGVVVRSESGVALVKVERQGGCGRCQEAGGCGRASQAGGGGEYLIECTVQVRPGDRVVIEVPQGAAFSAAVWAYFLPLAGVLGGAVLAYSLRQSDVFAALGALAGLALAVLAQRLFSRRSVRGPRIVGVRS